MAILEHRASEWQPRSSGPSVPSLETTVESGWSLEDQVRRAARLQRSLLPDLNGTLGSYRLACLYCPCEALGGDFYDLRQSRSRAVLLVADAMGHGVEAALTTMLVKAVFHEVEVSNAGPAEVLFEMDRRLRSLTPEPSFVAAAVLVFDPDGHEVRLANAGLPYPLLLRAGERAVGSLPLKGRPLGLCGFDEPRQRDAATLRLAPGDVLILASDGLGSIEDENRECFEDRRMRRVLKRAAGREVEEVVRRLMTEASVFSGSKPLPDDVNLVALTRREVDPNRAETID